MRDTFFRRLLLSFELIKIMQDYDEHLKRLRDKVNSWENESDKIQAYRKINAMDSKVKKAVDFLRGMLGDNPCVILEHGEDQIKHHFFSDPHLTNALIQSANMLPDLSELEDPLMIPHRSGIY